MADANTECFAVGEDMECSTGAWVRLFRSGHGLGMFRGRLGFAFVVVFILYRLQQQMLFGLPGRALL